MTSLSTKDESNNVNENDTSSLEFPSKFRTVREYDSTPAPNFRARVQRYFYSKGLADRPKYLQDIYETTARYIFVNQDLPPEMKNHDGSPILIYPQNKIRTTKYTPLSFLPKNLLIQFTNIANSYFLLVVILGAFQIFGVSSPGLAAVPLIVIVCITAIRDAIEDYKRSSSDAQLNRSPIHLLNGLDNPNVRSLYVGPWRRFKKLCSRMDRAMLKGLERFFIRVFASKEKKADYTRQEVEDERLALHRVSTVHSDYSYRSPRRSDVGRGDLRSVRSDLQSAFSGDNQRDTRRDSRYTSRPSDVRSARRSMQSHRHGSRPEPNTIVNPEVQRNNTKHATFKNRRWKDVNVGDFIRVRNDEEIPADIVVISSSDAEGNCFVETKNLDGETNLKSKMALHCGGQGNIKHSGDLGNTKFWIECDPPNTQLYSFKGTIHYENFDAKGTLVNADEREPITNDNVALRGCSLRNTAWIIGVVVYTGSESKVMLNSGITPTKISKISRELNLSVIMNFVIVFILCFVSGLLNGLFYDRKHTSRVYYEFQPYVSTSAGNGAVDFFVTLIIYQSLIPISLYISIEIIKTLQAFFIFSDVKMYYDKLDFPCIPKAWNISDDLGQIEYIFSDKTGTLTQNVMEFKKCTINGQAYGLAYTEAKQGIDKRAGIDTVKEAQKWKMRMEDDKNDMIEDLRKLGDNDQFDEESLTFISSDYVKDLLSRRDGQPTEQSRRNEEFMMTLALCHTVTTEEPQPASEDAPPQQRVFKAESPDETALVSVARDVGLVFRERLRRSVLLDIYGQTVKFDVLEVIPFSSARKRMSCVIRGPDNKIMLLLKGADNVMFQRLARDIDQDMIHKTALYLEQFASEGLRTLCIANRELDPRQFEDWQVRYNNALSSITDDREDLIDQCTEELERDLKLLGGTAIEDRLQVGVPEAISVLGNAGIKLWVLTGDRIETAINIGFLCNLLENEMKLLVIRPVENTDDSEESPEAHIEGLLSQYLAEVGIAGNSLDELVKEARSDHSTPSNKFAVVVDGAALMTIFDDNPELEKRFLLLGKRCKSVLCCRVSPSQKAQVVRRMKKMLGVMALAVGDGANDVAMIQAADIGVGIAGEEGRQAVMSSDYAVGQFRYLVRLLLVHGRWSYKRLAEMIPCFFYKNVVFTFTSFWYGIYMNFDGTYLYEYTFLMFFNLAFTSLPVIVLAVLDQDVSDSVSLLVPQLYRSGILQLEWSQYKFTYYMIDGLYQSVISYYFPYLLFYKAFQNPHGMTIDHRFWIGTVAVCLSVGACDLYVLLQQYRWDWLSLLINALSILVVFFWTGVWSARTYAGEFYKAGSQVLGTLVCWCCIFVGVIACLLPRFTYDTLKRNFRPKDIDIIREIVKLGAFDDYPEGYDPTNPEDTERHRLITRMIDDRPDLLEEKIEQDRHENDEYANGTRDEDTVGDLHEEHEKHHKLNRAMRSIRRRATIRSRKDSVRSRKDLINEQFRKPMDIDELRKMMMQSGELDSRVSMERINTTHELPGLTQAGTLISYHTRTSINFN